MNRSHHKPLTKWNRKRYYQKHHLRKCCSKVRQQLPIPQPNLKSTNGATSKTAGQAVTGKPPTLQTAKTMPCPLPMAGQSQPGVQGRLSQEARQDPPKELIRDNTSQNENPKELEEAKVQSEHNEDYSLFLIVILEKVQLEERPKVPKKKAKENELGFKLLSGQEILKRNKAHASGITPSFSRGKTIT